jgi:hypothetical protein
MYVTVDECMKCLPVAVQPGPAARLTPREVVTLALFYAVAHLSAAVPTLPARSQYHRCAAATTPSWRAGSI